MRHLIASTKCVRRAIKAVRRRYRPDLDGFKKNVVACVSIHFKDICERSLFPDTAFSPDREVLSQQSLGASIDPRESPWSALTYLTDRNSEE